MEKIKIGKDFFEDLKPEVKIRIKDLSRDRRCEECDRLTIEEARKFISENFGGAIEHL